MGKAIRNKLFDLPPPKLLPDTNVLAPYVVLGDEAFPLLQNLLKPYPRDQSLVDRTKAIFNYRLSRARRIVENAFGILTQRFRIFLTPIFLNVDTVESLVTSACIIHNMMIDEKSENIRTNEDFSDTAVGGLGSFAGDNDEENVDDVPSQPKDIRDIFKNYFNSVGAVSWQNDTIRL